MVNLPDYLSQALLACKPDYFNHDLNIKDGKVLQISATWVTEAAVSGAAGSVDYCNVIVTYTHPKFNDTIHTQVVLPSATTGMVDFRELAVVGGQAIAASAR